MSFFSDHRDEIYPPTAAEKRQESDDWQNIDDDTFTERGAGRSIEALQGQSYVMSVHSIIVDE
jgi:hypothetical protein